VAQVKGLVSGPRVNRQPFREVLALDDFRRLWLGQIISSIGDRFYQFALLHVVLNLGPRGGIGAGPESARLLFCGMLLPVVLSPWIGHFVDSHGRRAVMVVADLARAAVALVILLQWSTLNSAPLLFALVAVMGFFNGLFIPARQAAVPMLVPGRLLVPANALVTIVGIIGSLVGAAAGLVVSIFGETSSFVITSLGFGASAWFVARIASPLRAEGPAPERPRWSEGWTLARRVVLDPPLRLLFGLSGGAQFVTGLFLVFVVQHVAEHVNLDGLGGLTAWFASAVEAAGIKRPVVDLPFLALVLLLLASAGGLALAVATTGRHRKLARYEALPVVMFAALGGVFFVFAAVRDLGPALLAALAVGWLAGTLVIPLEARLQTVVPAREQGRIFSGRTAWMNICFLAALGVNLDGRLIRALGAPRAMEGLALGCLVAAAWLAVRLRDRLTRSWSPTTD
jgi:MFS family permease